MSADENPVRAALIAAGLLAEDDGELRHVESETPVLRLDDIGRAIARQRIAHPEPERGEWRRERER